VNPISSNRVIRILPLLFVVPAWLSVSPAVARGEGVVEIIRADHDAALLALRKTIPEDIPLLRGYRATTPPDSWPHALPTQQPAPQLVEAMKLVASRLAIDGLLQVTAGVIHAIGPDAFLKDDAAAIEILKQVGLPVDLLEAFTVGDASGSKLVRHIASRLAAGAAPGDLTSDLSLAKFAFRPSSLGFQLSSEAGQSNIDLVRMQVPNADYWKGQGDGSALDVVRGMSSALPEARLVVSIASEAADALRAEAAKWQRGRGAGITILPGPWRPAQWAQDNGKPGTATTAAGKREAATLMPRYASRGEERSVCDSAETFGIEALAKIGHRLIRSPLLFQGGNLIPVYDPATRQRVLLIGEAEVYRNSALGLSRPQVEEAFRVECGVDQVVVLPAVSFHIDVELSAREVGGKIVVLVNDELGAASLIVRRSLDAIRSLGRIDAATVEAAMKDLAAGNAGAVAQRLAGPVGQLRDADGAYTENIVAAFCAGEVDSGAASIARFLLAMDILTGLQLKADELPSDPFARAYVRSLQRRAEDRARLHAALAELGWRVAPVASLSDENRGINYVNGFHVPGRYLMPAYGGFFASVDQAAAEQIRAALGAEVEVVPVLCGETQRRLGAIHCAASIYPAE